MNGMRQPMYLVSFAKHYACEFDTGFVSAILIMYVMVLFLFFFFFFGCTGFLTQGLVFAKQALTLPLETCP
jgi:hypothetical protein